MEQHRRASLRRRAFAAPRAADGWFALVVLGVSGALVLWGGDLTSSLRVPSWPLVAVLQCGGIAFRRRGPAVALGLVWAGAIAQVLAVQEVGLENAAIPIVLYSAAAYGTRPVQIAGFASVLAGGALAGWFLAVAVPHAEGTSPGSVPFLTGVCVLILLVAWILGVLRVVTARATRDRVAAGVAAEQAHHAIAVEQERARIARDVHDVVAHSLTVMIAQVEGARLQAQIHGAADAGALITIADTGRSALAEVRGVLAELRSGERDGPPPSLARLGPLLDQFGRSGVVIRTSVVGEDRRLAPHVDVAAFRIAQEALTNAVRHGDPRPEPALHLAWSDETLELTVTNTVAAGSSPRAGGHGVIGMQERAEHAGGRIRISQRQNTFTVAATLPTERSMQA